MSEKKERRIVRVETYSNLYLNIYHSLKSDGDEDWIRHGRQYHIKGIDTLIRGNSFDFVVDKEVRQDLKQYRQLELKKRRAHEDLTATL